MRNDTTADTSLAITAVSTLAELETHAEQWHRLALAQPQKSPFLSYAWADAHIRHLLTPGAPWVCLLAYNAKRLVGVLPVEIIKERRLGTETTTVRGFRHPHSFSFDFLALPEQAEPIREALLRALQTIAPDWTTFQLNRITSESVSIPFTTNQSYCRSLERVDGNGSFISTAGMYEAYLTTLGRNFTKNLRKSKRRLDSLTEITFESVSDISRIETCLHDFLKVESAGWKGTGGSAIGLNPQLIGFYRAVATELAKQGLLEWHFLRHNDVPIAGHFAVRMQDRITVIKIGYDEAYSKYSPGNMLFGWLLEQAFADPTISEVDCLTDMPWHRNWRMGQRAYYNLYFFRSSGAGQLLYWQQSSRFFLSEMPLARKLKQALFPSK